MMNRDELKKESSSYKLLIIEDDRGLNYLIQKKLTQNGFRAEGILNGKDALQWKGEVENLILLLDYRLPDIPVTDIIEDFSKRKLDFSFIIMTGCGDEKTAVEMMKLGACDYLVKDEKFLDMLPSVVERVISRLEIKKELFEAQEALRKSEERLKLVLEGSRDAFWDWNIKTGDLYFSPFFSEITGYAPEEMEFHIDFREKLIHPEDNSLVSDTIDSHFLSLTDRYEVEYRILTKDGKCKWVMERGKVVTRDEKGKPLRAAGTYTDITVRKEAEEEKVKLQAHFLQAQKMEALGVLAGGIAHDFNNVLLSIIGYTELAMLYLSEGSEAYQSLEGVIEACDRAKELAKQILTFSRKSEGERKPLPLSLIVKESLKFLSASLTKNIEIKQNIHSKEGLILADSTQIYQVVMNLCTNGAQAIGKKNGSLKVSLCEVDIDSACEIPELKPGSYMKLSVKDTGTGMDEAVMKRIFEPFFTTKKRGEGTGMGLAVVHGIVKSHGGVITVFSEPGKGSCFDVFFPKIEGEVLPEPKMHKKNLSGKESILCVDDEKEIIYLMEKILGSIGYKVEGKVSSIEALETFRAYPERYDLIITDEGMPHMRGSALAGEVLKIRSDMPIILCTGFSDEITPEKALEIGIKEFILKPISIIKLAEAVRKIFD